MGLCVQSEVTWTFIYTPLAFVVEADRLYVFEMFFWVI